jgi:hypothetical protein
MRRNNDGQMTVPPILPLLFSSSLILISGCSNLPYPQKPDPIPKQQKVVRVWRGQLYDSQSKSICGIYTNPDVIEKLQGEGWSIKQSTPINHRVDQTYQSANCVGSEVVMEK